MMTSDNRLFDEWAAKYDKHIRQPGHGYPFDGYHEIIAFVQNKVDLAKGSRVLDLGVGTGLLTHVLYKKNANIYGIDFSAKMIEIARKKMPKAKFICFDLKYGIPKEIENERFDYIISSYAVHHLDDSEKISLILALKRIFAKEGKIIFADVAFRTRKDLEKCRKDAGERWDDEEVYMVADEMIERLKMIELPVNYTQISSCGGVLEIG